MAGQCVTVHDGCGAGQYSLEVQKQSRSAPIGRDREMPPVGPDALPGRRVPVLPGERHNRMRQAHGACISNCGGLLHSAAERPATIQQNLTSARFRIFCTRPFRSGPGSRQSDSSRAPTDKATPRKTLAPVTLHKFPHRQASSILAAAISFPTPGAGSPFFSVGALGLAFVWPDFLSQRRPREG